MVRRIAAWTRGRTRVPYESVLLGSLVVCTRCRDGDASRSPVFPSWFMARHEAWHDRQERAEKTPALAPAGTRDDGEGEGRAFHGLNHADFEDDPPVLERVS